MEPLIGYQFMEAAQRILLAFGWLCVIEFGIVAIWILVCYCRKPISAQQPLETAGINPEDTFNDALYGYVEEGLTDAELYANSIQ